jgi:leader peptidase (prepilin peptidase)/N-methyltransferase
MSPYASRVDVFVGAWGLWPVHVLFAAVALPLALIDQATHRLPDVIVLPTWAMTVGYATAVVHVTDDFAPWVRAHVVMAIVVVGLWLLAEAPGQPLGFGDVKLGAVIGFHLGWYQGELAVMALAIAFVCGGVWALFLWGRGFATLRDDTAFGPWLVCGYLVALLGHRADLAGG